MSVKDNVCIFIDSSSRHKGYTNKVHRDKKNRVQNHSTIEQSLLIGREKINQISENNVPVHRVNINTKVTIDIMIYACIR